MKYEKYLEFNEIVNYAMRWLFLAACIFIGLYIAGFQFDSEFLNYAICALSGLLIGTFFSSTNETFYDKRIKSNIANAVDPLKSIGIPILDSIQDYKKINKSKKVTLTIEKAYNSERDVGLEISDPWRLSGRTFFESIDAEISFDINNVHPKIAFEPPWQTSKGLKSLILLELPESLFMKIWEEFINTQNADIQITVEFGKENVIEHIKDEAQGEYSQLREGFFKPNRITYQKIITKKTSSL